VTRVPNDLPVISPKAQGLDLDGGTYQRERLFAVTVDLVAKRGYRDTTIEQIVGTAGTDLVTFYDLFESKEACFLAAFDRIVEEGAAALRRAIAGEREWPRQMAAALACLLDLIAADPKRARVALVEVQAAGPNAYAHYEKAIARVGPKLREGLELGEKGPWLTETLDEAILGGIIWIIHQRLVKGELGEVDAILDETIQISLSPFTGDGAAKRLAEETLLERSGRA
jgi:AcrR family transcriptional regulator